MSWKEKLAVTKQFGIVKVQLNSDNQSLKESQQPRKKNHWWRGIYRSIQREYSGAKEAMQTSEMENDHKMLFPLSFSNYQDVRPYIRAQI